MTRSVPENLTRRTFLAGTAAVVAVVASACGAADDGPDPVPQPTATTAAEPTPTQGVIASPVAGYGVPTKWQGRTLTVAARGGDYQDAQNLAFFEPFAAATGVEIQVSSADTARMKGQVDQSAVTWDVMMFPAEEVIQLARGNYLEPIDYAMVDKTPLVPDIVLQYGVGADFFSTVILYAAGADHAPQSWADFWDVEPPKAGAELDPASARALRKNPVGTLEFALLADGVAVDRLYPLDVERAFASLQRIKANVAVWYEDGKLPVELVVAKQVAMASAWNVRPWQLHATDEVRFEWYGGMLSADVWVSPRGAPNRDIAMDFINFATRAAPSANFARLAPYGPVNTESFPLLRPDRAAGNPSAPVNRSVQFVQNWNWWADNLDAITLRFDDWLLQDTTPATPVVTPTT